MRAVLISILMFLPLPLLANDLCDDLWFSRNLAFDQMGYCFGSPLGEAMFDNSDCSTKSPQLGASDLALVAQIKEQEALWGCNVDTSQTFIEIDLIDKRRQIIDPVYQSGYESACMVWRGMSINLHSGAAEGYPVIGLGFSGQSVHWEYEWVDVPDGWAFLTIKDNPSGETVAMGWSNTYIDPTYCDMMAG